MSLGRYRLIGTGSCAVAVNLRRFGCCVASMVAVIAAASVVFLPAAALAVGGPALWQKSSIVKIVHSTRVTIQLALDTEELATEYDVAYAPAETDGKAPLENSLAWKLVNSGTTSANNLGFEEMISIGAADPGEGAGAPVQLRGLKTGTSYYARFVAKNAANQKEGTEAVEKVPFKTLGVEKPQIDREGLHEEGDIQFTEVGEESDTAVAFSAKIETNGSLSATKYSFEYALPESEGLRPAEGNEAAWLSFTSGPGTIPGEYGKVEGRATGLEPETLYYIRLKATNEAGETTEKKYFASVALGEIEYFTTGPDKPGAGRVVVRNVKADSAQLGVEVTPHGSRTLWRLESASTAAGPWNDVATGEVTQKEAEAIPFVAAIHFGASFTGLSSSTGYYVRLVVKNEKGKESTSENEHFGTSGAPNAKTFSVHAVHGESWRLFGAVDPNSEPTSSEQMIAAEGTSAGTFTLLFGNEETELIEYNPEGKEPTAEAIRRALEKLGSEPKVGVVGPNAGPFRVFFVGLDEKVSVPPIEVGSSAGVKVVVSTIVVGGEAYDAHYRFQYQNASSSGAGWEETPEEDVGSGGVVRVVGVDVAGLKSGDSYRYRVVASNNAPGTLPVEAAEQTLAVPGVTVVGTATGGCANEAFRTGLLARLPDCRAYEQVTPVDKKGAQEPFHYRGGITTAVLVGEDGNHVALEAPLADYGSGPDAGQSPYLFSRAEGKSWEMLAGSSQPETGISGIHPQVYSADLTVLAFRAEYATSVSSESPNIEYKIGDVGGPYTLVASAPRKDVSAQEGWVAATGDFSKLVLQVADHALLGEPTGTVSGPDLYEYTAKGGLRQLNVDEQGSTIGSCGARIVHGEEGGVSHLYSGPHSISADGSRVFFEAVPGGECAGSKDLYMRVDGSETVDIGAYEFMAADADGTTLLLKNAAGEFFSYDIKSGVARPQSGSELAAAEELGLLDIPAQQYNPEAGDGFSHSRYTYFAGGVAGLPGDGIVNAGETAGTVASQVYRYDSVEHVVQCVSCASSSDPEPVQNAYLDGTQGQPFVNGGLPEYTLTSANGDFAFFTTTAALVREDVDGEIPAINNIFSPSEFLSIGGHTSPSTDVYEWRRDGLDGCAQLLGCLALITDGRGGYLNLLLGSANEGRDVFIDTHSKLSSQDNDIAGDIYDVRVGGGLPEAPPPAVECEADACSTPPSPPNDTTPSSFTFNGKGNVVAKKPVVKPQKHKAKKPKKKKAKKARGRRGNAKKSQKKGARR